MRHDSAPRRFSASLRRSLRSSVDEAARISGVLRLRERESAGDLTVLMYHRVLPTQRCVDYPFESLAMPVDAFRSQVRWLVENGDVLPLGDALVRIGERRPRRVFALTFDDGYEDAGEFAAPVLEEFGVRGTFFVTTGFVGTRELLWFDEAALLFAASSPSTRAEVVRSVCGEHRASSRPQPDASAAKWVGHLKGFGRRERSAVLAELELATGGAPSSDGFCALGIDRLVELHQRGHEIGSHTVTHPMLPRLDDQELERELADSRDAIARWLGSTVRGFCFPNGELDDRTVAAVRRAGHEYACTTRDGLYAPNGDRFRIRRVDMVAERVIAGSQRRDSTALRRELCGLYRRRS